MTHPDYPIIERRPLSTPKRRLLRGRSRSITQVPTTDGHHRRVYRVHGDYVLDNGAPQSWDDADHVSVVDVSRDVEVPVQLRIRSAEDSELTVEVTFTCGVTDPLLVVQNGLNAARVLTSYLQGHHRFYELALGFHDKDINEIRRHVNAQVTAFTTVQPPRFAGVEVTMASVQVHTPEEWAEWARRRRTLSYENVLQAEQEEQDYQRKIMRTKRDQALEVQQTDFTHTKEFGQQQQKHLIATKEQRHLHVLHEHEQQHLRAQVAIHTQTIGSNPLLALSLALQSGAITNVEYADAMRELQEQEEARALDERRDALEWARQQGQLDREEQREDRAWARRKEELQLEDARVDRQRSHEERVKEIESAYETQRVELMQRREDDLRRLELEQALKNQEFTVSREDAKFHHELKLTELQASEARRLFQEQEARETARRQEEWKRADDVSKAERYERFIEGLLKRGHFDTQPANVNLDGVIGSLAPSSDGRPELTEGEERPQAALEDQSPLANHAPMVDPQEDDA